MKTKLEMAHDWFMKNGRESYYTTADISSAWQYADKMQAEADKRKVSGVPDAIAAIEWQPDWSQAPERMNYWFMNRANGCFWTVNKPDNPNLTEHVMDFRDCGGDCYKYAPSFNYQGDWKDSLRKRP